MNLEKWHMRNTLGKRSTKKELDQRHQEALLGTFLMRRIAILIRYKCGEQILLDVADLEL